MKNRFRIDWSLKIGSFFIVFMFIVLFLLINLISAETNVSEDLNIYRIQPMSVEHKNDMKVGIVVYNPNEFDVTISDVKDQWNINKIIKDQSKIKECSPFLCTADKDDESLTWDGNHTIKSKNYSIFTYIVKVDNPGKKVYANVTFSNNNTNHNINNIYFKKNAATTYLTISIDGLNFYEAVGPINNSINQTFTAKIEETAGKKKVKDTQYVIIELPINWADIGSLDSDVSIDGNKIIYNIPSSFKNSYKEFNFYATAPGITDKWLFNGTLNGTDEGKSIHNDLFELLVTTQSTCIPNLTNTTWTSWYNSTTCRINDTILQQRNLTQYDQNFCGETTNQTVYENQEIFCDYCTENITGPFNTTCNSSNLLTQFYVDDNYNTCCVITGLVDDCHITNGTYIDQSLVCINTIQTTSSDIQIDEELNIDIDIDCDGNEGLIEVYITSDSNPIDDVKVIIKSDQYTVANDDTDEEGLVIFNLVNGEYRLKASKKGYIDEEEEFEITCELECECGYIEDNVCYDYDCCENTDCPPENYCENNICKEMTKTTINPLEVIKSEKTVETYDTNDIDSISNYISSVLTFDFDIFSLLGNKGDNSTELDPPGLNTVSLLSYISSTPFRALGTLKNPFQESNNFDFVEDFPAYFGVSLLVVAFIISVVLYISPGKKYKVKSKL